ncbi:hypothetical protein BgiBS90_018939 [Biomphalaria glabrata]|nr:hypothetical protein BgiBS90_018939 [Biomphalaria glabrata]
MVPLNSVSILVVAKVAMCVFFRADSAYAVDGVNLQQENSLTFCTEGLLDTEDQMVFKTIVNLTKFNNTLRSVSYLIKRETRRYFKHICFMKIPSMCNGKALITKECHCQRTDKMDTYALVLKITALQIYSRGFVKTEVMLNNLTVLATDTIRIPPIYDPSYVWSSFLVNDNIMSETDCRANANSSLVKLGYTCDIDWPSPCWLEITDGLTNNTILQGSDSIQGYFILKNDTNLILRKRYCNSSYEHVSYCILTIDVQKEQVKEIPNSLDHTVLICVSSLSIVLLVIGAVMAFLCWRRKGKNTRKKGKSYDNEGTETIQLNPLNLAESQSPELVEETETIQLNPLNLAESQSPELETQSLDDVEEVTD